MRPSITRFRHTEERLSESSSVWRRMRGRADGRRFRVVYGTTTATVCASFLEKWVALLLERPLWQHKLCSQKKNKINTNFSSTNKGFCAQHINTDVARAHEASVEIQSPPNRRFRANLYARELRPKRLVNLRSFARLLRACAEHRKSHAYRIVDFLFPPVNLRIVRRKRDGRDDLCSWRPATTVTLR